MINASIVAHRLLSMLPAVQRPEHTDGYEGFYHLLSISGNVEHAEMQFIIRDHNMPKFNEKKEYLRKITNLINLEYKQDIIHLEIKDQYFNMREKIEPVMYVVEIAREAMKKAGINPNVKAIRGGTDGARLSYEGLPCPNVFAGGHNFHGPYEFIPVPSMHKAVEVIMNIAELAQIKL